MGDNARKKERRRLKRQQKVAELRRAKNASIFKRIADIGQPDACYINSNWRENGQAVIYLLIRLPGGGCAMANFLVDLWCAGLKDAWGRPDITHAEFEEDCLRVMERRADLTFQRIDVELARRLVAGGIRFASQNGFRLPHKHERWTAMLKGMPLWQQADLGDFGVNGKLRWCAPLHDLRKRLLHGTAEEFLQRPDVEFIVEDSFPFFGDTAEDDEEDEAQADQDEDILAAVSEVDERLTKVAASMAEEVKLWCGREGRVPHPMLDDAAILVILTAFALQEQDDSDSEEPSFSYEHFLAALAKRDPQRARQLTEAIEQIKQYSEHLPPSPYTHESKAALPQPAP